MRHYQHLNVAHAVRNDVGQLGQIAAPDRLTETIPGHSPTSGNGSLAALLG
jgi:hypothetical protein